MYTLYNQIYVFFRTVPPTVVVWIRMKLDEWTNELRWKWTADSHLWRLFTDKTVSATLSLSSLLIVAKRRHFTCVLQFISSTHTVRREWVTQIVDCWHRRQPANSSVVNTSHHSHSDDTKHSVSTRVCACVCDFVGDETRTVCAVSKRNFLSVSISYYRLL